MEIRKLFFCIALLSCSYFIYAQNKVTSSATQGKSVTAAIGFDIPFGEFPDSHSIGIGADVSWSNHRFGSLNNKPSKAIGFIFNSGFNHYFGKGVVISGNHIQFSDFNYVHSYGGIICNTGKRGNINVTAGPALAIEGELTDLYVGVNLAGSYYVSNQVAITPAIIYMQHSNFIYDNRIAISLKASMAF